MRAQPPKSRLSAELSLLLLIAGLAASSHANAQVPKDLYGLYYADWDRDESAPSLVISPDDKAIPPKGNDPDAPTIPGFHLKDQRYPFASSKITDNHFTFKTTEVSGTYFSFEGNFKRQDVEDIPNVPYLEGTIVETHRGRKTQTRKIRFEHAVIL